MNSYHLSFISVIVLTLGAAESMAKCRVEIETSTHYETKMDRAAARANSIVNFGFGVQGGEYYLMTYYGSQFKGPNMQIDSETPLTVTFSDGEELALAALDENDTERPFLGIAINNKRTEAIYPLTREFLETMRDKTVTALVVSYRSDGEIDQRDYEVKASGAQRVSEMAACVLDADRQASL